MVILIKLMLVITKLLFKNEPYPTSFKLHAQSKVYTLVGLHELVVHTKCALQMHHIVHLGVMHAHANVANLSNCFVC